MEVFAKIVNGFQLFIIFSKSSIEDVLESSEYVSGNEKQLLHLLLSLPTISFLLEQNRTQKLWMYLV